MIGFRVTKAQHHAVARLARKYDVTITDLVKALVEDWVRNRIGDAKCRELFPPRLDARDLFRSGDELKS